MHSRILNYLKAGYPAIAITTHEESRAERIIAAAAAEANRTVYVWSLTGGLVNVATGESQELDAIGVLQAATQLPEPSVIVLRDYHLEIADHQGVPNAIITRAFKDFTLAAKAANITAIIVSARIKIPLELEKQIVLIPFTLPTRQELREILNDLTLANNIPLTTDPAELDEILDAASGLTTTEAEDAFSLSYIEATAIDPAIIRREKAATIQKQGILEIVPPTVSLDDIGGLERFKASLRSKRNRFTTEAAAYGIPAPRGVLAIGQAGTGKSLTALALAAEFRLPCIRLEAGRLFDSLVGGTEANWRAAFATARAIAPCILWIDEVDGLFAGSESSGRTDGGTTARVIKTILQDMQFNSENIFWMFTANDIDGIPDPVISRMEEVWNVELPHQGEREAIWRIHIAKKRGAASTITRNPTDFDIPAIAAASEGFSGREIEQVWIKALGTAFCEHREPTTADILDAIKTTVPASITMSDKVEARRKRLTGRATPASEPPPQNPKPQTRKLNNP